MVPGAVNDAPLDGLVRLTVGGRLADWTVTVTVPEVVVPPSASWATAVSGKLPAVVADQLTE